ncbi:MAG: polyprenol monophosphomannose synthase [Caulobacteraceae bacterium]|nr:polyprenol monophosphomannose synthase [Caulobacteraceae bacterium]
MNEPVMLKRAPARRRRIEAGVELTVIAPTFNERANVARLVEKLDAALDGERWEVLFVDDNSPDGTAELVKQMAASDSRIRCLRRVGRRGLAGAITEGMLASAAPFVAVIDADLQHDETLLPRMLTTLRAGDCDVVAGSRYLDDAGLAHGLSPIRKWGSQVATALARRALGVEMSDPMGGFFMARREVVERVAHKLSPAGFKLLFDIAACQPEPLRVKEIAYAFKNRTAGESKMDARVVAEYFGLLAARLSGDVISPQLIFFVCVGGAGLVAQMLGLALAHGPLSFARADAVAAFVGATVTYLAGQAAAYRARRRKGLRLLVGYLRFAMLAALGVAGNVALAVTLSAHGVPPLLAGLAGAACGAVWSYAAVAIAG